MENSWTGLAVDILSPILKQIEYFFYYMLRPFSSLWFVRQHGCIARTFWTKIMHARHKHLDAIRIYISNTYGRAGVAVLKILKPLFTEQTRIRLDNFTVYFWMLKSTWLRTGRVQSLRGARSGGGFINPPYPPGSRISYVSWDQLCNLAKK